MKNFANHSFHDFYPIRLFYSSKRLDCAAKPTPVSQRKILDQSSKDPFPFGSNCHFYPSKIPPPPPPPSPPWLMEPFRGKRRIEVRNAPRHPIMDWFEFMGFESFKTGNFFAFSSSQIFNLRDFYRIYSIRFAEVTVQGRKTLMELSARQTNL